ncbi:MAG TPA: glycosyltransferase family 39 protein [Ktedonobacterales bacterium]
MSGASQTTREPTEPAIVDGSQERRAATGGESSRQARWPWLRHWELWLAIVLAAALRLWHIELTQFLDDQTGLMQLARGSFSLHALPVTGIISSIGTLNPPLSVYVLEPFAAFTADPMPAAIVLALWNVLGIALCYVFTLRYFGRRVAGVAALLFATCPTAINYSRFLWQQNYLPPIIILWAFAVYAGCVRGRRGWLAPAVILLLVAIELHPTAIIFLPITALAIFLAPTPPTRRDWTLTGVICAVILLPTALFELTSRGFDLRRLYHVVRSQGHLNLDILRNLKGVLDGPSPDTLSTSAVVKTFGEVAPWLTVAGLALFTVGYLVLSVRTLTPLRESIVPATAGQRLRERLRAQGQATWRALRADALWRARLMLWLWVTIPITSMLRHSVLLTVHYLIVLFPAIFIVMGLGAQWLLAGEWLAALSRRVAGVRARQAAGRPLVATIRGLTFALLLILVVGQGVRWALYPVSLAAGHFSAYQFYGFPLNEMESTRSRLSAVERTANVSQTFVLTPDAPRYKIPAEYMFVDGYANRVGMSPECLVLPAPSTSAALVMTTVTHTPASDLVDTLPGAQVVSTIPMTGGDPFIVYRLTGAEALPPDTAVPSPLTFSDRAGNGLQLQGESYANGLLRLRWQVTGFPSSETRRPVIHVDTQAPGGGLSARVETECAPIHLAAGETLYTWLDLTAGGKQPVPTGQLVLTVSGGLASPNIASLGPLRLLAAADQSTPLSMWPASGHDAYLGAYVFTLPGAGG